LRPEAEPRIRRACALSLTVTKALDEHLLVSPTYKGDQLRVAPRGESARGSPFIGMAERGVEHD